MITTRHTSVLLLYFGGAFLLLWLKSPDALFNPQFWAEDGPIFFKRQFEQAWPLLFAPYAGYLHVAPRFVAWAATVIDFSHAPAFYNLSALLIDALCIAYATFAFGRYFGHAVVFLSFFIVPSVGDIFGTVTNVQWFMQFVLAAACFLPFEADRQHSLLWRCAGYSGLLIAALSGPFSIMITALACGAIVVSHPALAPLHDNKWNFLSSRVASIALVGKHIRGRHLLIVAVGACVQLAVILTHDLVTPWREMRLSLSQLQALNIEEIVPPYVAVISAPFSVQNILVLVAIVSALLTFFVRERRPSIMLGVCILLVLFGAAVPLLAFAKQRDLYVLAGLGHYFYFLTVAAVWIAWRAVEDWWQVKCATVAAVAAYLLVVCMSVRPGLCQRPALHDFAWQAYAIAIRAGDKVVVPINPVSWHFVVETPH